MNLLAVLCGIIVATMSIFNGQVSNVFGTYIGTLIIHVVGLITFIIVMIVKKQKLTRNYLPIYFYFGGVIGVFTVIFQVNAIGEIGTALLTALGLLGQMIASLILQIYGLLGSKKHKISFKGVCGLIIVMIGVGVMLL